MEFIRSDKFKKQFAKLPLKIKNKANNKLLLLETNFRHPSLHTKKMQGKESVWEGRVDRFYRFTFEILGEEITFRTIGPHDEALT